MEEVSVNGLGLSTMCRLCLSKAVTTVDIFVFSNRLMDEVANVIMKCAPVQVTRCDEMPNFICQSCNTQLEKNHQFQKQIIQSDHTLRRYLQQIRISKKQIKAECSNSWSSKQPSNLNADANITMKCETLELQDVFDMNIDIKDEMPTYKINEDIPLKTEIKEPPMDDSFIPTEYTANLIDRSSEVNHDIEIVREKSEIGEPFDSFTGNHFASVTKHLPKRENKNKIASAKHKKPGKKIKMKHKCDVCNKCFRNSNTLRVHRRMHNGEKTYKCNICTRVFSSLGYLKSHNRVRTGEKPYQCDLCGKHFNVPCALSVHKRTHTDEKPYKCDVCNKCFRKAGHLHSHKRTHTGEKLCKLHQCDVCGKCFPKSDQLKRHKLVHTEEKPYKCDVCNKCFKDSVNLKIHKRMHTGKKPYQCDVCGKCFIRPETLRRHRFVHTGEKRYRCGVCDKSFNDPSHWKRHERIHTGEKPHQCEICDKRFSLNQHLKTHLKGVHKKSMLYNCTSCDEKFKIKRDLNLHIEEVHNVSK